MRTCETCGLDGLTGKQRKHQECRAFDGYIAALDRILQTMRFGSSRDRRHARAALFVLANRLLPVNLHDDRGPDGRFVPRGGG